MPETRVIFGRPTTGVDGQCHSHLKRKNLFSLSKSCRAIRNATLPNLYKNISMVWERNAPLVSASYEMQSIGSPPLDPLLRTVLEKPYLADYITSVFFRSQRLEQDTNRRSRPMPSLLLPPLSHTCTQLFQAALENFHMPMSDQWLTAINKNRLEAIHVPLPSGLSKCSDTNTRTRFYSK